MSLSIINTRIPIGIHAQPVTVEIHLANGLPSFQIVGLPEKAVQESRERVRSAITNSQLEFPQRRITVNLAPADIPKEGGGFDLPIAIGILQASGQIPENTIENTEFIGELALSGNIRPVKGILPIAIGCKKDKQSLFFPSGNINEVKLVNGLQAYACQHLLELTAHLNGTAKIPIISTGDVEFNHSSIYPCLSDIKGQPQAKRALIIAAAGNHSLLMVGPPGSGKSMLAQRLPGIIPQLSEAQALETAAVHSISHQRSDFHNWREPPFRAPHHSASSAALVGGGSIPKPGEISLAHNGVLFLDELTEFDRRTLDVLREPLENGYISLSRVAQKTCFPSRFQLIAAMNPCPCGYLGDIKRACGTCTVEQIKRYQGKLSGPVMDRIDLHIEVPAVPATLLSDQKTSGESSELIRVKIKQTRDIQLKRQNVTNSQLDNKQISQHIKLNRESQRLIQEAIDKLGLSARAYHRILRVSRTIADLENSASIETKHIAESISYRKLDREMR